MLCKTGARPVPGNGKREWQGRHVESTTHGTAWEEACRACRSRGWGGQAKTPSQRSSSWKAQELIPPLGTTRSACRASIGSVSVRGVIPLSVRNRRPEALGQGIWYSRDVVNMKPLNTSYQYSLHYYASAIFPLRYLIYQKASSLASVHFRLALAWLTLACEQRCKRHLTIYCALVMDGIAPGIWALAFS